jgi:hypothetical protein
MVFTGFAAQAAFEPAALYQPPGPPVAAFEHFGLWWFARAT